MKNPLLSSQQLPLFEDIRPQHIEPAIDHLLAENRARIDSLLAEQQHYTWDNTVQIIEDIEDSLARAWSPINHLHSVADNKELRAAYNACLPKLSDYSTEMGQNKNLYRAYQAVRDGEEWRSLSVAQQKIISNALREFRLSGIDLPADQQRKLKEIKQQLSRLETKFEENLLDVSNAWTKHVCDAEQLAGLPESALALARQKATDEGLQGWVFCLEFPSYIPVMQYADNRILRKEFYTAYVSRASDQWPHAGDWDNSELMEEILALRHQQAELLGFNNYADYSLLRKMAKDGTEVLNFLYDLATRSKKMAEADLAELQMFAKTEYGIAKLEVWDIHYYAEKLRHHKYALSEEELRSYFPVPQVLNGLSSIVNRLYGLKISERSGVQVWHKDVRFFDIYDAQGRLRGGFYLDIYARKNKRGGAWMDECVVRRKTQAGIQTPIAYLNCNFTPAIGNAPALLTHNEVLTLFHEFGHGLHHMLTLVDHAGVSGINGVPWDAVELPSQFMENWCWERAALGMISKHYVSGETISDELFARMIAAKNFQAGMQMLRQLEFSIFDFRLHQEYSNPSKLDIQALVDKVRRQVAVIHPPAFNRFQHSFAHIFAGGYAAGYYSYKWAEVLSADAFSKFQEQGIFNPTTGREFMQCILERGGEEEPMQLFIEFRGRKPSIEPLLQHTGIVA